MKNVKIKENDAEKIFMKLLGNPEPKKYELTINCNYLNCMEIEYWAALRKRYKSFKIVDNLPKDIMYLMKEVE